MDCPTCHQKVPPNEANAYRRCENCWVAIFVRATSTRPGRSASVMKRVIGADGSGYYVPEHAEKS